MKKSFISIFILIAIIASMFCGVVYASETINNGCAVYIDDDANLLDVDDEQDLVNKVEEYWSNYNVNVVLLTTSDANGKSTMTWSDDYLDEKFPSDEDNIALVIDMDNREIYVNTMGVCISRITDGEIVKILDEGFPYVSDGMYAKCLEIMSYSAAKAMASSSNDIGSSSGDGSYTGHANKGANEDGVFDFVISASPFALIFSVITGFVFVSSHNSANKKQAAVAYVSRDDYEIIDKSTNHIRSYQTKQYVPKSSGSSGGSGGSSHRSSSGRSHGGGGRKF